jgi:hypothetical protein
MPFVLYGVSLARILLTVRWFEWIETKKHNILGDKRRALTPPQRRSIYFRILWLIVPTDRVSFYFAQPSAQSTPTPTPWTTASFLIEFAAM